MSKGYLLSEMKWIPGDPWCFTDCCYRKMRRSQVKKRWDGMIVCYNHFETKHPALYPLPVIKGELRPVKDPRGPGPDVFYPVGYWTVQTLTNPNGMGE